ncbi:alpha/beta fold hydrolase [Streptacidiphilus neutrinimicus]|uniref:alpha/beta fold hydrolase n=1 Tax=Streptacidiphilus neutrinimicus TaxID=105420 RepID=UPI00137740A5|nr:alpha/beta hydrolase [Streptacidiphilus neutrinimicus]
MDLETHVADLTALLTEADLRDTVLVAHSGGIGAVTGAADRRPERIRRMVPLDSGPLPDGAALADSNPGVAKVLDGWRLPMPPFEALAESGARPAALGRDDAPGQLGLTAFTAAARARAPWSGVGSSAGTGTVTPFST